MSYCGSGSSVGPVRRRDGRRRVYRREVWWMARRRSGGSWSVGKRCRGCVLQWPKGDLKKTVLADVWVEYTLGLSFTCGEECGVGVSDRSGM